MSKLKSFNSIANKLISQQKPPCSLRKSTESVCLDHKNIGNKRQSGSKLLVNRTCIAESK